MPDTAPPPAPAEHRFPCDQCGADLRFAPAQGRLVCDHCGHAEPIDDPGPWAGGLAELDFRAGLETALPDTEMEEVRRLKCPNCGAEFEMAADRHATECPFCATPVVTDTGAQRRIKPQGVLPFALEERDAHTAMTDWLGRLWFAPNGLKDYARKGRRMDGIYVPYWTYDAATHSRYSGARGTVYHETRTVMRDGKPQRVQVQKVRWAPVSGRVARAFDDILVLATTSLPKRYTDALQPWDLSELDPYRPEYLAGFRAEGYTVGLDEGFAEARAIMDRAIRRDVKFDIGGDRQRIDRLQTQVSDVTFKHVLLPVWLAAYKYRGRTYRFVVNGRTGRVQGERPWSAWKIALAVILGLLLAAAVGYLAALGQQEGALAIEWQ
ncbi:TFIIB-type zinc finger domain-containing protein [Rhodovulum marinum]|uniref:RNA polymerase I specific transcription initiation factor RRN7 n=1 Tax=Rhodovulum marinum TaxID=320662 RepID=A0A4R2Q1X7_9RHOB|nr:TFIIB-type zinc finger domain-containing protein [Rhodovulum marinum]TCP41734.1 RNA polymerase I specific transcription initiation factor RRN7 [Rhodovulum marinum]